MDNISLNNEPLTLQSGSKYIIIDALYVSDVRHELTNLNKKKLLEDIRKIVFPYTDTPFAEYTTSKTAFYINQLEKVNSNNTEFADTDMFSTDTGIVVIIHENIFVDFVNKFDYNTLLDSTASLINIQYWKSVTEMYNYTDTALLITTGINSSHAFDGSGTYKITS